MTALRARFRYRHRLLRPTASPVARPRTRPDPLADELLALYTPRTLIALEAIVARLDGDLRAAPSTPAIRLGLVHAPAPGQPS